MSGPKRVYSHLHFRYDHWYDIVIREVWSSAPSIGFVGWWVDGQRVYGEHIADLWTRPDGSHDHVNFELNNYRQHASWSSTIYYSRTAVGPTRASVAF
jgi:hypothetical protein